jgi:hypothetical protein
MSITAPRTALAIAGSTVTLMSLGHAALLVLLAAAAWA